MNIEDFIEDFDYEELKEMVEEVNDWNGHLKEYRYYENDADFFNENYYHCPFDAVRDAQEGYYNYDDEYVRYDSWNNLESASESGVESELIDNAREIIEEYVNIIDNVSESDLKEKVKGFLKPKMTKDEIYAELRDKWHLCNTTTLRDIKAYYKEITGLDNLSVGGMINYLYNYVLDKIIEDEDADEDTIDEIKKELKLEGE